MKVSVEFAPCEAGLSPHCSFGRVDPHPFHLRQVDDDATIANGTASNVVTGTTHPP